jgi:hypothetical protein
MESKYNYLSWFAEFNNFDMENLDLNNLKIILQDFGLVITDIYNNYDKIQYPSHTFLLKECSTTLPNPSQTFLLENGSFIITTLSNVKWCSISLKIPYIKDFDIIKFKNTIKMLLQTEEIIDTLDLIYRKENI